MDLISDTRPLQAVIAALRKDTPEVTASKTPGYRYQQSPTTAKGQFVTSHVVGSNVIVPTRECRRMKNTVPSTISLTTREDAAPDPNTCDSSSEKSTSLYEFLPGLFT